MTYTEVQSFESVADFKYLRNASDKSKLHSHTYVKLEKSLLPFGSEYFALASAA